MNVKIRLQNGKDIDLYNLKGGKALMKDMYECRGIQFLTGYSDEDCTLLRNVNINHIVYVDEIKNNTDLTGGTDVC